MNKPGHQRSRQPSHREVAFCEAPGRVVLDSRPLRSEIVNQSSMMQVVVFCSREREIMVAPRAGDGC